MDPKTKIIYDVFNINVYSSVILPERIVLNVGAEIDFLKKDEIKKANLSKNSEWVVDDPSILYLDEKTGMGVALREGVTSLHLVSKDLRKEKLVTEILVKKVKKVILDFSNLPKYFTDIKSDPLYRKEYIIPLRFYINDDYEELAKNSEDEVNFIDQKLKVKCVSKEPEIFVAEIIQKNVDKEKQLYFDYDNECKVTIRNIPFENVNFF